MEADELQESPVAFGDVALQVQKHDPHRRLVEQPVEADFRPGLGLRGLAVPGQPVGVAQHHRTAVGRPAAGIAAERLHHRRLEGAAVLAPKRHAAGEFALRHRVGTGAAAGPEEIAEGPGHHVLGRQAQPAAEGLVGVQDIVLPVGREKTGRQQVQEIGQVGFLLAADGVDLAPGGDVLDPPQGAAFGGGDGADRQAPPFHGTGRRRDGDLGAAALAGRRAGRQALKLGFGLFAFEDPGDGVQGRHLAAAAGFRGHVKKVVKSQVGIDERPVGAGDQEAVAGIVGRRTEKPGHRIVGVVGPQGPGQAGQGGQRQAGNGKGEGGHLLPAQVQKRRHAGQRHGGDGPDHRPPRDGRPVPVSFKAVFRSCHPDPTFGPFP